MRTIAPPAHWPGFGFAELWRSRELVYFLALRDIQVRYRHLALGIVWAALQPILATVVLSLFLGRLASVPSDGLPYPLFVIAGLVAWHVFFFGLTEGGSSLVSNERLITKVYFPRMAIPLAAIAPALLDYCVGLAVVLVFQVSMGIAPSPKAPLVLAFGLLGFVAALGVAAWLAALNARYRDFRYAVPFLAQLWFFVTPVAYPATLVPEKWLVLYSLNPMVAVVTGFRWALLEGPAPSAPMLAASVASTFVMLCAGIFYFRRTEQTIADVL